MRTSVIDTNVLIVANGRETHASIECQLTCITFLKQILEKGLIGLDSTHEIISEYKSYMNFSGQPGAGDAFFLELHNNIANQNMVNLIEITRDGDSFREIPDDIRLRRFDLSDHKFLAVALVCNSQVSICNATDSDWEPIRAFLQDHRIGLKQLCQN